MEDFNEKCRWVRFQEKCLHLSHHQILCLDNNSKDKVVLWELSSNRSQLFNCSLFVKLKIKHHSKTRIYYINDWFHGKFIKFPLARSKDRLSDLNSKINHFITGWWVILPDFYSNFRPFGFQNGDLLHKRWWHRYAFFTDKSRRSLKILWKSL